MTSNLDEIDSNVEYVHFKPKVVGNGFICSYCNEFFVDTLVSVKKFFRDDDGNLDFYYVDLMYPSCPNCLHSIEYDIEESLLRGGSVIESK